MPEGNKILIVAESIDVEDSSGSKANVALIQNLRDLGYRIIVLHYTRREINLPGIECISIKEKRNNLIFLLSRGQRRIQRGLKVNLAKYLEPLFGFSFTFFNDTRSIVKALDKKFNEFDLVITLSKGASFRPHFALLQIPALHEKWLAYIHDPYPFCYYPEPFDWKEPGYQKKIDFFMKVSKNCQWAAFPSELLKDWMAGFFPDFEKNSMVIPHQMRLEEPRVEVPEYLQENKFTLLHAGFLLKQRPPIPMIQGFKKFLQKNPEARNSCQLLLVGNAPDHQKEIQEFQKEIDQLYFSNGYVGYKEVLKLQNLVSVNIILESEAPESPFLPGKFPHCVAADKPILLLGPKKSECRRLLGEDYPYWSEVGDIEKISSVIEDMYRKWKLQEVFSLNRKDIEYYLSRDFLRLQLDLILKE